jgi:hypothetical protein
MLQCQLCCRFSILFYTLTYWLIKFAYQQLTLSNVLHNSSSGYVPTTDCVVVIHIATVIWNVINKLFGSVWYVYDCLCVETLLWVSYVWYIFSSSYAIKTWMACYFWGFVQLKSILSHIWCLKKISFKVMLLGQHWLWTRIWEPDCLFCSIVPGMYSQLLTWIQ